METNFNTKESLKNILRVDTTPYNQTKSFRNENYKNETKLSSFIWDLKE